LPEKKKTAREFSEAGLSADSEKDSRLFHVFILSFKVKKDD
jgi:hypothetical protein